MMMMMRKKEKRKRTALEQEYRRRGINDKCEEYKSTCTGEPWSGCDSVQIRNSDDGVVAPRIAIE